MKKLAFLSDVHGNATALEAVLRDIERKGADAIYVLGDLCYRGPEPKRALKMIQGLETKVIKGNADEWVTRGVQKGEVPDRVLDMMNKEREWTVSQLNPAELAYLADLPDEIRIQEKGVAIHAFHATPDSLFDVVGTEETDESLGKKLMSSCEADVYVYAHIHKPYIRYINGKIVLNTGSVGLPFDGVKKASYALVTIEEAGISTAIERVAFDADKVAEQYEQAGYPNQQMKKVVQNASLS